MNRKILSLMTAILVVMMAFYACKKDSGGSGGGDNDPDNPFIGTWISDDYEGVTLEVNVSKWTMKEGSYTFCSGTYESTGKNAELTVSTADPEYVEVEKGDKGTARVSGNTMTVTFDDATLTFTKDGDTPPPPPPDGDLYREPYLGFGASMSTVKSYEDRTLDEEGDNSLVFLGENKDVSVVYYGFVGGQLDYDIVALNCAEKKAMDFLSEKYTYLGPYDGMEYFETSDETTYVALYHHPGANSLVVEYGLWADKSSFPTVKKSIKSDLLKSHK